MGSIKDPESGDHQACDKAKRLQHCTHLGARRGTVGWLCQRPATKTSFPPAVDRASSTREKTKINLPPPWVEHGIFRLQGERINHYATEAGGNQHFWDVKPIHIACNQAQPGKPGGGAAQRKAGCRRNSRMSPSMAMAAQVSRCSIGCSCFPFERQCTRRSRIVLSM